MGKSALINRLSKEIIVINRAPLLTLWCSIVSQSQGHSAALSLKAGRIIASMLAQAKGRRLGILPRKQSRKLLSFSRTHEYVMVAGFKIPLEKFHNSPTAAQVSSYLEKSFGSSLPLVFRKLRKLCRAYPDIDKKAYSLYEQFRPKVSNGVDGWAQKSILDLKIIDRIIASR